MDVPLLIEAAAEVAYHGDLSRSEAEACLSGASPGTFLLRRSTGGGAPALVLSSVGEKQPAL